VPDGKGILCQSCFMPLHCCHVCLAWRMKLLILSLWSIICEIALSREFPEQITMKQEPTFMISCKMWYCSPEWNVCKKVKCYFWQMSQTLHSPLFSMWSSSSLIAMFTELPTWTSCGECKLLKGGLEGQGEVHCSPSVVLHSPQVLLVHKVQDGGSNNMAIKAFNNNTEK